MKEKENPADLVLGREEVRACDRVAIERYEISGLVLMENAGLGAAQYILSLMENPSDSRVCIVAGTGNNGGDGFVVARHIINAGVAVEVILCGSPERIGGDARSNLRIIEHLDIPIHQIDQMGRAKFSDMLRQSDLLVDAMLGTGTAGPARQPFRTAIETINQANKKVIALDIPSGLDCDTGEPLEVAVRADYTITFAAMKKGFQNSRAAEYTGRVKVVSIGIKTDWLREL